MRVTPCRELYHRLKVIRRIGSVKLRVSSHHIFYFYYNYIAELYIFNSHLLTQSNYIYNELLEEGYSSAWSWYSIKVPVKNAKQKCLENNRSSSEDSK